VTSQEIKGRNIMRKKIVGSKYRVTTYKINKLNLIDFLFGENVNVLFLRMEKNLARRVFFTASEIFQ